MNKHVVLYGAGRYATDNWDELNHKYSPICFCDSDPKKWRTFHLGLKVLSPEEVKIQYKDALWYVSIYSGASNRRLEAIDDLIKKYHIEKERIINYIDYYYGFGCPYVQSSLFFQHDRIQNCCENPIHPNVPFMNFVDDNQNIIDCLYDFKRKSLQNIKNIKTDSDETKAETNLFTRKDGKWIYAPQVSVNNSDDIMCKHCRFVKKSFFTHEEFIIESMQISSNSDSRCNFKCPYCCEAMPGYVPKNNSIITKNIIKTLHILQEAKGNVRLKNNPFICISFGEPALHPNLGEIFEQVPGAFWQVLTNASVYSEHIQHAISNGEIVMSLDSGTSKTFKQIKGIDCFEKVKSNLIKYRNYGDVVPKYIIIQGINDNDDDIDGFVEFCKIISPPRVEIVRDHMVDGFDYQRFNWPDKTMRAAARLFDKLNAAGLKVVPVVFPDNYEETLKKYI